MLKQKIFLAFILYLVAGCTKATPTEAPAVDQMDERKMETMDDLGPGSTGMYAPAVAGFYEGGDLLFIHTEASDADVASMLTDMMGGPAVVVVPELAGAPDELVARVYVFTNGVEGMGPFGFQPDIFDSVPGDDTYRPLRRVSLVKWLEDGSPRELRSLGELQAAEGAGEIAIQESGIVVNMPILVWPGGSRIEGGRP